MMKNQVKIIKVKMGLKLLKERKKNRPSEISESHI